MVNSIDWDKKYLQLAALVSTWSKDKAKVGAVLVRDNRIVGTGFNGFPTGVKDDERLNNKPVKQAIVVHAEENALLVAGDRARGATMYVYGKPVCARCAASIIQAKVELVVGQPPKTTYSLDELYDELTSDDGDVNWDAMGQLAIKMLNESRISAWQEGSIEPHIVEVLRHLDRMPANVMSKIGHSLKDRRTKERRSRNSQRDDSMFQ